MKKIEFQVPDALLEGLVGAPVEAFDDLAGRVERLQGLAEREAEAGQRQVIFWFLLLTGIGILGVSLFLILGQAFGLTKLPESSISTLVGSVAVEFIGMLWAVVRYLFPQGSRGS